MASMTLIKNVDLKLSEVWRKRDFIWEWASYCRNRRYIFFCHYFYGTHQPRLLFV